MFWWDCCKSGCWSFEDEFNRDDKDDIGSGWVEQVGNARIDTNRLKLDGDAADVVHTAQEHPKHVSSSIVNATAKNTVLGGKYRLLINYDRTTGHWLEMEQQATKRIITLDTGDSTEDPTGPGGDVLMYVCYTGIEDGLLEGFVGSAKVWDQADPITGGWYAGLANNSPGTALHFDDFKFEEHYRTNQDCPACHCKCGYRIPAHQGDLLATITANGCLEPLDGTTVLLEPDPNVYKGWAGLYENVACGRCSRLSLQCVDNNPEGSPADWYLYQDTRAGNGCATPGVNYLPSGDDDGWESGGIGPVAPVHAHPNEYSVCYPFSLEFGSFGGIHLSAWPCCEPFPIPDDPAVSEGHYWITITEAP